MNIYRGLSKSGLKENNLSLNGNNFEGNFIQSYFLKNKLYFRYMLGSRLDGRNYLIESDMPLLKEAYEKAHQKANFEIDLHWKRTTHVWTLMLALLIAAGSLVGYYFSSPLDRKEFVLSAILLFSVISIVVCKTPLSILKVSHKWCNNWESHIVMLEPLFSGMLYQTHIGMGKKRLSLSNLNVALVYIALSAWIALFELSILLLSTNIRAYVINTFVLYTVIILSGMLTGHAISSKDEENIPGMLTRYNIKTVVSNSLVSAFFMNLKIIGRQFLYMAAILIVFISALYFTSRCFFNINIDIGGFYDVFNLKPREFSPFLF